MLWNWSNICGWFFKWTKRWKRKRIYNNQLIFEGDYLYGYRRKGKEYVNGRLEYEGEYLFDKKWNGIGFDNNGNKIYQIINGKGKIKEYNPNGYLIYEGEYKNYIKEGKGKEYHFSKGNIKFEGDYSNEKKGKEKDIILKITLYMN